ncbi:MAG: hypothetical protein AVO35_01015 [Candidatus Aegiribacteria sp. MLS_C]|nr:MAG: hypothetical protein AVO35_01015 [Candidatus Aegiribacteria sp. MLS_C]
MKRTVPLMIVMVGGILMMVQYFIPHQYSQAVFDSYVSWAPIIAAFALILGVGSLTRVHAHKIRRKAENWQYSWAVLIPLYAMPVLAHIWPVSLSGGMDEPSIFHFLFMHIQVPIQATMFSMLAFYIASAAFRAFRAKSALATVLLLAAVIVMLGQVPIGDLIAKWFPQIGLWILRYPNLAAKRAIMLGVGFGILATNLKIIFGVERNWLGGAGK